MAWLDEIGFPSILASTVAKLKKKKERDQIYAWSVNTGPGKSVISILPGQKLCSKARQKVAEHCANILNIHDSNSVRYNTPPPPFNPIPIANTCRKRTRVK